MDSFVKRLPASRDNDLMIAHSFGVAYQADMSQTVPYDEAYFDKCAGYEDKDIALKINAGRIDLVNRYVGSSAPVIDIGIGSGEFIKKRPNTFGWDINRKAIDWLYANGKWAHDDLNAHALTFWDVIEHIENPKEKFRWIPRDGFLFTCLPIFSDLTKIRESRHYRPNEHLYYWTEVGFVNFMAHHGFALVCRDDFETRAGRDSILSFAFVKEAD